MPTLSGAYTNLGNALRVLGKPEAAVVVLKQGLELNGQSPAAYTNLGIAMHAMGASSDSVQWLALAARMAPTDISVITNLGGALEATSRLTEAQAAYERGVELHMNRGKVLRRAGRLEEAVTAFYDYMYLYLYTTALQLEPTGSHPIAPHPAPSHTWNSSYDPLQVLARLSPTMISPP